MITIHHEKETDFSKNGYGAIDDYVMSQEVTWEMNGQFNAFLEYPAFLDKSKYLVNKNILRVPVPFMEDQLFRIYRVRKVLGFIQVEARHIFYDLMDNLIEDTNIVGKTGSQAIQQLLGATQYEHRFIGLSDISTSNNARMVRYNPVEALLDDSKANTFVSRWGGEIVRDNFLIRMARQMGTDRGVRIQHRKDLTAYIATIDESTVVTRIMPVGFDGLKLPELYIDSPLLDPDNPKIGVIRYENVKAAIGEYADDNGAVPLEEAYELLRNHAKAEFSNNHIDEPEMTVTVNFVTLHNTKEYADFAQLQEIHQGDVVRVSVPDEDFEITSRLVAFTSDPLQQNHYTSTTLGNHVYEFTSSTNSVSTLRNEVEALRESVVEVRQSANGKNQSFWGEDDPNTLNLNAILGDTYFRSVGEEDVIYQYVEVDGERYWKEIINTANTTEVKKEVERVAEEAEKLADDITEAQQSADDAKRDAGLALTGSEALEIITQETASQLSDTRGLLATVESNASEARAKADSAVTQAGQAVSNAQTAMGDAQSALSKASDAESTVSTLSKEVDTVAGEVALKAGKSIVDTLSGTVSTHATTLTQHATAIASKASQTEVDTISGTVSTNTSTLSQHAKEISARLTQSQVDNLVSGKGYSTVSYVDTQMSATAGAIRTEMTAIEGKIPTEIGGRNLVLNTQGEHTPSLTGSPVYTLPLTKSGDFLGKEVTFSFKAKSSNGTNRMYISIGSGSLSIDRITGYITIPKEYEEYKYTFTSTTSTDTKYLMIVTGTQWHPNNTGSITVTDIKLEKGRVATDWSPAPEDMMEQNDFNSFKASYEKSAEGWSAKLLQIEQADYASKTWSNQTFATPQSVTTQLQSYAKTTDLNGLATETYVGSQLSATAGTIRSEITAVEGKIPTYIGGRNYLLDTDVEYINDNTSSSIKLWDIADVEDLRGQEVTISFELKSSSASNGFYVSVSRRSAGTIQSVATEETSPTDYKKYEVTFSFPENEAGVTIMIVSRVNNFSSNTGTTTYRNLKLEKGNIATDWSPAPEDMATSAQVSSIKQKADSLEALVGDTKESVARAVMTSSLWETEVSKVIDSELEQEYETVLSPVHVLNETEHNSGETFSLGKYFNYSGLTRDVPTYLQNKVPHVLEITMPATQNKGQFVYVQTKNLEGKWVSIGASFNLPTGQFRIVHKFTSTVFSTSTADYRLVLENGGNPQVNTIYSMRIYRNEEVQVPIEGGNTGAISTKITQLYDMINLSVLGQEGALSRIAMGEEGIQLKSDLIHLDGKVKMTEAFAQKLFAEEVSADTVTAFSAKFANAIVGNLDVNNIGGNKASFIQLLLNGTNTALRATSSVVDIMRNDGSISTRLTQNGMEIWRDGSKVGDFESRSSVSQSGALANKKSISMTPERDSYISLGYYKSGETTSTRVLSVAGDTGRIYIGSALYPSESSTYGLQIQRFTLNSSGGIRVGSTGGSSGIFFGDFGHVSIQFNGIWYAMDRLIN